MKKNEETKLLNKFLEDNYSQIISMTRKITLGYYDSDEVAHYCILEFMEVNNITDIINRGEGMKFLSGIIHRSFHSKTSPYYKLYKQKGKETAMIEDYDVIDTSEEYVDDMELIEQIECIINKKTNDPNLYYKMKLLREYVENPNYSALSRKFNIPRTSLSLAIKDARKIVLEQLKIK
jgi:hypothetical protein